MALKVEPLSDRIVVRPDDPSLLTDSGLHIPTTAADRPQIGTVLAVGPGRVSEVPVVLPGGVPDFPRAPMTLSVGQRVLFGKYTGAEIEIGRDKVLVLRQTDVLAIVT